MASLLSTIRDPTRPIGMRMRAAYYLRQAYHNNNEEETLPSPSSSVQETVIDALSQALEDIKHGSLMRHEFAYILGQLRDKRSCPVLHKILSKETDCVMVRHEAAEALGAIGDASSLMVLEQVRNDNPDIPELTETCQVALNVMHWRKEGGDPVNMPAACACMLNPYSSVDPAPPHPSHANLSMEELGAIVLNSQISMFERYRAMFSLRNIGGAPAVEQLCRALVQDESSALLRHEVAYVLGQLQHPDSVEALESCLRRSNEHHMVRHEAAEALGAINGRWEDVERILNEFLQDEDDVVRESCEVALDAADYWGHSVSTVASEEVPVPVSPSSSLVPSFTDQKNHHQQQHPSVLVNHFNIVQ